MPPTTRDPSLAIETEALVKVFGATRPRALGTAPVLFASFSPYPGSQSGVSVAAGLVDAVSGRASIVTAPGAGEAARIKTFRFDLYTPNTGAAAWCAPAWTAAGRRSATSR